MNTKTTLKEWQPGDTLAAADLQAIPDTVAMLESNMPGGGIAQGATGGVRVITDGPQEWPWQVFRVATSAGYALRYIPGQVLVDRTVTPAADDESWPEAAYSYLSTAAEVPLVEDFDPASKEPSTIWLELTGTVEVEQVAEGTEVGAGAVSDGSWQRVQLTDAALRVTCAPAEDALRVWPLAIHTPGHAQPLTQLLWGELSALEVRGIVDADGAPLWPVDRSTAAEYGEDGHAEGMATLCHADFSTPAETIEGDLHGVLDSTGALELYLGPYPSDVDPGPDPDPWTGEEEEEEPEDDPPPGPFVPVGPSDDDEPPSEPTRVRYGYVAGEGFSSCTLVRGGNDKLYWELVLDTGYLASICANLKVPATVTFSGNGTTPGVVATVEMGLGTCTAAATGTAVTGSTVLLFHGTNNVDVSKKTATIKVSYDGSPSWAQEQAWYLSPRKLHQAGNYVKLDRDTNYSDPWVEAYQWYRWRVDKAAFRKAALAYFKQRLAAVSVADSASSTSYEATVSGTLSGTLLKPKFTITL